MKALAVVHKFVTQHVIKQFAAKHHFVYFGAVDAQRDEHELIRGITASASHVDSHYTVGTFRGHDIMLVQRRSKLVFPGRADVAYSWLILELDIKQGGLPHIFINMRRHPETFYANFKLGFAKMHDVTSLTVPLGKAGVYAATDELPTLHRLFSPDFVAAMHNFSQFDYEINDDQVLIYSNAQPNATTLTEMLRVGAWLAEYLGSYQSEA